MELTVKQKAATFPQPLARAGLRSSAALAAATGGPAGKGEGRVDIYNPYSTFHPPEAGQGLCQHIQSNPSLPQSHSPRHPSFPLCKSFLAEMTRTTTGTGAAAGTGVFWPTAILLLLSWIVFLIGESGLCTHVCVSRKVAIVKLVAMVGHEAPSNVLSSGGEKDGERSSAGAFFAEPMLG